MTREFFSAYFEAIQPAGLLPRTLTASQNLLELLLLEEAFLEIDAELTERLHWVEIPLRGAVRLLEPTPPTRYGISEVAPQTGRHQSRWHRICPNRTGWCPEGSGARPRAGFTERVESLKMVFSRSDLQELIREKMSGYHFVVVANREPFIHKYEKTGITVIRPASGMASALHPVMLACDGTWVGHGSGDADRAVVDDHDRVRVPPEDPRYTLRRVWLTPEQEEGYYYGLANSGLWPLCHITFTRPHFDPSDWESYREVNRLFADAVLEEVGSEPAFVFIQDFHFCLLPRMLKNAHPRLIIAQFWHIPWPNREVFRTFPWGEELARWIAGQRPARLPRALSLPELPGHG